MLAEGVMLQIVFDSIVLDAKVLTLFSLHVKMLNACGAVLDWILEAISVK